jgi:hypothetical protein
MRELCSCIVGPFKGKRKTTWRMPVLRVSAMLGGVPANSLSGRGLWNAGNRRPGLLDFALILSSHVFPAPRYPLPPAFAVQRDQSILAINFSDAER